MLLLPFMVVLVPYWGWNGGFRMSKIKKFILLFAPLILLNGCLTLDGFLFNSQPLDIYQLPNNDIDSAFFKPVTLNSDGHKLYAFWVMSEDSTRGVTVLYCHGNKHNMDEYWDRVMFLHEMGLNVFIFDYRGYGKSEGQSSEAGLHADGKAALAYLLDSLNQPADSLILYGYSLGNVVSIYLATLTADTPLGLIAESPFASANSLTQASTVLDIPAFWLTEGNFDNAENIKQKTCPLLLLHGKQDDFVRYRDNGRVVFENAPDPKKAIIIENATHADIPQTMGIPAYKESVLNWINSLINL